MTKNQYYGAKNIFRTARFQERPPLTTLDGYTLQNGDMQVVLSRCIDRDAEFFADFRQHIDPEQLYHFARWVYDCWIDDGPIPSVQWPILTFGALGGEKAVETIIGLIRTRHTNHHFFGLGFNALGRNGSKTAFFYLFSEWLGNGSERRRLNALQPLGIRAQSQDISIYDLGLQVIPEWNYDGHLFDYGSRQFTLSLSSELDPVLRDENGKVRADLPKPGQHDVPRLAAAALAEWEKCQQFLQNVKRVQARLLEAAMITEIRWTWENFSSIFLKHPLLQNFAQRLVWGVYENGQLERAFIVGADYTLSDAHYQTLHVAPEAEVGIIHPIQLSEEQQSLWSQVLHDYEIVQPFLQLGRYVYRCTPEELQTDQITCFTEAKIQRKHLTGYSPMNFNWARVYDQQLRATVYRRYFANHLASIIIKPINHPNQVDDFIYNVELYFSHTPHDRLPLAQINSIYISECLFDLTRIITE